MQKQNMYIIAADIWGDGTLMYLAWQPDYWANSMLKEYFWTSMETLRDILTNNPSFNMPPHQFAFGHEYGAHSLMKRLGMAEHVIKIDLDAKQKLDMSDLRRGETGVYPGIAAFM